MSLVLIGKDLLLEAKQRTNGFQVYNIYIYISPPVPPRISHKNPSHFVRSPFVTPPSQPRFRFQAGLLRLPEMQGICFLMISR